MRGKWIVSRLRWLCLALSIFLATQVKPQSREPNEAKYERSSIVVSGQPTDSIVTIHYSIQDSAHVHLRVIHRSGEVFASAMNQVCAPGSYSHVLSTKALPQGTYTVELILDHIRSNGIHRGWFTHFSKQGTFSNSRAEVDLLNEAMILSRTNPLRSIRLYDSLLTTFPFFVNRSSVYSFAVGAFAHVADSTRFHSIVDSLFAALPISHSYRTVARALAAYKRELPFAQRCAQMAITLSDDVPPLYRDSYQFFNYMVLADVHIASGDDTKAEEALYHALSIHDGIPYWDRFALYNVDVVVLKKLASLKIRQKQYLTAVELSEKALRKEAGDAELWALLQHAFTMLHHSGEGYVAFKDQLQSSIEASGTLPSKPDSLVGRRLQPFVLGSLDTLLVRSSHLKGKVFLIYFWSFWAGDLDERTTIDALYHKFADRGFVTLAVHSRIGLYGFRQADSAEVAKAIKAFPASYLDLVESENSQLSTSLGVRVIPTCVVVDKWGIIRFRGLGYDKLTTPQRLSQIVEKLLSEK